MRGIENFCCQNLECPDAGLRGNENLRFSGWSGKGGKIRMVVCRSCKAHFSERRGTALERARLPIKKVVTILEHLREGCGIRATARLVKVDKNTVMRYAKLAGDQSKKLHDELVAFSPNDH